MKKSTILIAILLLAGALSVQAIWLQRVFSESQLQFSDRVNLALRQTAHNLLRSVGDTTSRVPAVEQTADNAWLLRLNHQFDYECLPPLLTEALHDHAIEGNYEIGIYDCMQNELILGYAASTADAATSAACATREQPFSCFYLKLIFTDRHVVPFSESVLRLVATIALLLGLLGMLWFFFRTKKQNFATPETSDSLQFGQSELLNTQLMLKTGQTEKTLTYREAKLLRYMAERTNQLLPREQILQDVWEDEGIIVGRSLDVFISRLRKLLADDESIRIVSVHGVGYRMEIRSE